MLEKIKRDQYLIHKATTLVGAIAGVIVAAIILAKAETIDFVEETNNENS